MSTTIPKDLRAWVREQDRARCAYCHSPENFSITLFEVDHIVPLRSEGHTEQSNICLCCSACNRFKGTRQSARDPGTGVIVAFFHPRAQEWTDHFAWSNNAAVLVGLTPIGRATVAALQMNRPALVSLRKLWQKLGYSL